MYVRYLHVDSPPLHSRGSVDDLPGSDVTHAMTGLLGSHWRIQIGTHTNNLLTSVMGWGLHGILEVRFICGRALPLPATFMRTNRL